MFYLKPQTVQAANKSETPK